MRVLVVASVVLLVGLVIVSEHSAQGANPNYSYHVKIEDPSEANYQEKAEKRLGDYTEGFYSVVQPDGALRTVKYTADPDGFHPEVTYTYGHPVPPVKKVLVAGVQGQAIAHNVPSVSYQQLYSQAPEAVVPLGGGSGGYHSYVNTGNQYAASYGTPVFSVKESRQFIKSPAHAQAAAAVLTTPLVQPQQVLEAPGGYSYTAPQQSLQYHVETTKQVAQPVVVAQPPKVEVSQPALHVVQTPVQTLIHQNAQFHAEVQKVQDVQYVQQAPVYHQQVQYAQTPSPPIVHQYINRAPVKQIQYVQPQPQPVQYLPPPVVQQEVVQAVPPPLEYLPPAKVEVKPVPPPVTYLPPPPAKVEPPPIKYLPPAPAKVLVESQPAPPAESYLPPQNVVVEKPQVAYLPPKVVQQAQYIQPQIQYVQQQPQVQYVQQQPQVQYVQQQPQFQYFQQAAPVIHKQFQQQFQYVQQAPVIHKQVQQYVQPQVRYTQQTYVEPARVEYEQVQYVQGGPAPVVKHEVHYAPAPVPAPVVQAVSPSPTPVLQAVSPSPTPVVHYAPQHLAYEPAQPAVIHHNHQQILTQPRPQVVRKYEDIVVQNLDVMRYAAAPVHQYLAPPTGAKLRPKLVTQLQTTALATPVNGKQNPLTFNYGYDSGVSKVSHSYFGSGW